MTPLLDLPKSRAEIERLQSGRKKHALAQARRARFYKGKLDHVNAERLDDPDEWRKIPLLDKDTLRKLDENSTKSSACRPTTALPNIGARAARPAPRCSIRAALTISKPP